MTYPSFPKIPRWDREVIITEKIDGTNGQISVLDDDGVGLLPENMADCVIYAGGWWLVAGSKNRWLTGDTDNFGFFAWVLEHAKELVGLGLGRHYGEWYGKGVQRGYGLSDRRFMLFNTDKWAEDRPSCCEVATVITSSTGSMLSHAVPQALDFLREKGSMHVPGFLNPEGVVMYHKAGNHLYKTTLDKDSETKSGYVFRPFKVNLEDKTDSGNVIRPISDDYCGLAEAGMKECVS